MKIKEGDDALEVVFDDGVQGKYHWIWLRDSCTCEECFNTNAKQKYYDPVHFDLDIRPSKITLEDNFIKINWKPDNHLSQYDITWLKNNNYYKDKPNNVQQLENVEKSGFGASFKNHQFNFEYIMNDSKALSESIDCLISSGLVIFKNDSGNPPDYDQVVMRLAGFTDRSYFGDYFDLETKPRASTDSVSFSAKPLHLHTDIPYYITPPDFQFLLALSVSEQGLGKGATQFVDGLPVAEHMRQNYPEEFETLSTVGVTYRAPYPWSSKVYEHVTPIIKLDQDGRIESLYNNPSKMFFENISYDQMPILYRAYHTFKRLLAESQTLYQHRWQTGDMVIYDNHRIFHGRDGFDDIGSNQRLLRGGYFKKVELLATKKYHDQVHLT